MRSLLDVKDAANLAQAEPHPYQTASPLSRMLFFFIELPMWRFATGPDHGGVSSWIPGRPKKQLDFPSTVPRLPDVLHSRFILDRFRWRGDGGDEGEVRHGRSFAFALEYKLEVAKIVLIALVWVFATFLSPLSMNLVRCLGSCKERADTLAAAQLRTRPWAVKVLAVPFRRRSAPRPAD